MAHYLASYKTGFIQSNGRERLAIGFCKEGRNGKPAERLFSIVPHLCGHKIPSLREAFAIARGETIRGYVPEVAQENARAAARSPLISRIYRDCMIADARRRAEDLRASLINRDADTLVQYVELRTAGVPACKAIARARNTPRGALFSTHDAADVARRVAIESAADELAGYLRDCPQEIENPRKAFRSMYGINRMAPAFVQACR